MSVFDKRKVCAAVRTKEDFDFSTEDIIEKSESIMKELLECILQEYTLNDLEKEMLPYYKFITMISFYPNVQLWISLLEENVHVSKVIELLNKHNAFQHVLEIICSL